MTILHARRQSHKRKLHSQLISSHERMRLHSNAFDASTSAVNSKFHLITIAAALWHVLLTKSKIFNISTHFTQHI